MTHHFVCLPPKMIRYKIKLTEPEIEELNKVIKKGKHNSQTYRAAHILLSCDEGKHSKESCTNREIAKVLGIGMRTIDRVKKKFVEKGIDAALNRRPTSRVYERKMDGDAEAKLVKLCCSEPPEGFSKWTLRLLADKMVELEYVESISHVTVSKVLKKTNLSPGK